jgi:Transposase, Mutator family
MACLVASGVAATGERRILGLELAPGNDEGSAWPAFIRGLVERGLHGVRLVISDDHAGLVKAVREQLLGFVGVRLGALCRRAVTARTSADGPAGGGHRVTRRPHRGLGVGPLTGDHLLRKWFNRREGRVPVHPRSARADVAVSQTQGNDAQRVFDTIGEHATVIDIGPYKAAITHSSVYPNGMRIYLIYWSDGTLDFGVGVNGSAAEAIETAQSMYCK